MYISTAETILHNAKLNILFNLDKFNAKKYCLLLENSCFCDVFIAKTTADGARQVAFVFQ